MAKIIYPITANNIIPIPAKLSILNEVMKLKSRLSVEFLIKSPGINNKGNADVISIIPNKTYTHCELTKYGLYCLPTKFIKYKMNIIDHKSKVNIQLK